jgi:hypothetical protein
MGAQISWLLRNFKLDAWVFGRYSTTLADAPRSTSAGRH